MPGAASSGHAAGFFAGSPAWSATTRATRHTHLGFLGTGAPDVSATVRQGSAASSIDTRCEGRKGMERLDWPDRASTDRSTGFRPSGAGGTEGMLHGYVTQRRGRL